MSFRNYLIETFKNYKGNWRGDGKHEYHTSYFNTKQEKMTDAQGKAIAWKHQLENKKPINDQLSTIHPKQDGIIHRGMSHREYHNFKKTGKIKSWGHGNIGETQKGTTLFSRDPDQAASYAGWFAMPKGKPTPKKAAYVVSIKEPHPDRIKDQSHITSDTNEVAVKGEVHANEVVAVHKGTVVSYKHPFNSPGFKSAASFQLHWTKHK